MKEVDLSLYENSWYQPGSIVKRVVWYFTNIFFFKNPFSLGSKVKTFILRIFGAKIGSNVVLKPGLSIKYPWFLTIGRNSWIGENVWVDCLGQIDIGENVCISQGAMLLSGNHNYKKETFDLMVSTIIIENGVWIGAKSIVTQGVRCSSHAVLSVGSVTSKDLDPYVIYAGNPAIKIRERFIE